jgi:hypothetical protein
MGLKCGHKDLSFSIKNVSLETLLNIAKGRRKKGPLILVIMKMILTIPLLILMRALSYDLMAPMYVIVIIFIILCCCLEYFPKLDLML